MIKDIFCSGPVFPIPPSFDNREEFDEEQIKNYLLFLYNSGVKIIMTTAGTSQFNLLSIEEIRLFNDICANSNFNACILGIPILSKKHIIDEISYINSKNYKNVGIILIYPDRYYDNDTVINFFNEIADFSNYPIFIHGLPIRNGIGSGNHSYDKKIIECLSKNKNIFGMKEESPSYEEGFQLCSNLVNKEFIFIVAGGSQRRFTFLHTAGAQTFLSGIGNIYPELDIDFFIKITSKNMPEAIEIMNNYETVLFKTFMKLGWHKSLREGLRQKKLCCFFNRQPFPKSTHEEKLLIKNVLEEIERKYNG